MVHVGVAGCGYWGSKHVRVLSAMPDVARIVAIDPYEERVSNLQRLFPSLDAATTLEDALDRIDAVVIATPPRTHAALATTALRAGKSVLVEKPLATSTADAAGLVEEAANRAAVLMVGHTFEFNAAVWKLRELVQGDELGQLFYLDSARLNLGLYQSDVNVIWDLAPHDISIFNYVLGGRPASVQAWGSRHAHDSLEDVAYLRLLYPDVGVTANVHVSWLDPCKVRRVTAVGSRKMAVYNDLATEERVRIFDRGVVPLNGNGGNGSVANIPMSYRYGEIRSPHIAFEEPLLVQDRHFVSSVMSRERPDTDGENGLAVVQVLEAAELSLRLGHQVDLDQAFGRPATALTVA
ncbi:MAG: Gfo/Idh/MocA family protein [Actinomycetota bacterium]